MEPTLMVVGLNYRTAPVAVREHFWIAENRRYEALVQLSRAEGIEEVIVMATCNRTEFWLWATDVTLAANSVMRLLGAEYGLKLCEWKHFYRLLDEAALAAYLPGRVQPRLDGGRRAPGRFPGTRGLEAGAEGGGNRPIPRRRVGEGAHRL